MSHFSAGLRKEKRARDSDPEEGNQAAQQAAKVATDPEE